MKKTSLIIVPLAIILLIIAGAFFYRTYEMNKNVVQTGVTSIPNTYSGTGTKPSAGLGNQEAAGGVSDLTKDLNTTVDDGGANDLQTIKNQAGQL